MGGGRPHLASSACATWEACSTRCSTKSSHGCGRGPKSSAGKARDAKGVRSLIGLVATEQLIHTPLVFLPAFYITKEAVEGDAAAREGTIVDNALAKWRKNLIPDMCADMLIWVPSNLVNFAFVPQHFRVPFVALTSFAYTMVLSCMRGGATAPVVVEAPVPAVCAAAAPLEEFPPVRAAARRRRMFAPAPAVVLPAAPLEEFSPVRAAARRRRMFAPAPTVACAAP